jgi:ppGpp synthetase/RelA/SpoT-type nucleotidyltranferase
MALDLPAGRIARDLEGEIASELARLGLLVRVFGRAKDSNSAQEKMIRKDYGSSGRKLQDAVGVRATLYFSDDVTIAQMAIRRRFGDRFDSQTVDRPEEELFGPQRLNLVFKLLPEQARQVAFIARNPGGVDTTFEVQIRTVLSEGWHEVEHDLRYKRLNDWADHSDLGRALNGVLATLETCDWSLLQVFDELALRHYRRDQWESMIRAKFRLRFASRSLSATLESRFRDDRKFRRSFFRASRRRILEWLVSSNLDIPLLVDNMVYLVNHVAIGDDSVRDLAPTPIREQLDQVAQAHREIPEER